MRFNKTNVMAFIGGLIGAYALLTFGFPPAFGDEPPTVEPILVLQTQDDGSVTAAIVKLPIARPESFQTHVCFREYMAKVIRCYAVDDKLEVRFVDLTVQ